MGSSAAGPRSDVERASYCFFCGCVGRAGAACTKCFVPVPDPSAPEPFVHGPCPRCTAPLRAVAMDRGAHIHACTACGGLFVGARAWCMFLERPDLVAAIGKRLPQIGVPPAALVPMVPCASCRSQMERGRFAASSGVVVDVCPRHGVWLDQGELQRVAAFAASPQRGALDAPLEHPVVAAVAEERQRIALLAATMPRKAPRPLWLKLVPLAFLVLGVAARWYYISKLAAESPVSIPQHGEETRSAGEQATKALGGR